MKRTVTGQLPGALVLSLDFELAWGLRDQVTGSTNQFRERIMGARKVVPRLLELFEEFDVAATWATVGFLFARSREDLQRFTPVDRPIYENERLSPYAETIGDDEDEDPLHYAGSLVRAIKDTPRQELGTHTFSHYYCSEPGQTRDNFRADIASACAIAATYGVQLRSIVFPRNQHNVEYDDVLLDFGFRTFRGNPLSRSWEFSDFKGSRRSWKRLGRFTDVYFGQGKAKTVDWSEMREPSGLSNIRASGMLRPFSPTLRHLESLRLRRIRRSMDAAARHGRIVHLWWHPHNFGFHHEENLGFLRRVLIEFSRFKERYGMRSLSMSEADDLLNWEGQRVSEAWMSKGAAEHLSLAQAAR